MQFPSYASLMFLWTIHGRGAAGECVSNDLVVQCKELPSFVFA